MANIKKNALAQVLFPMVDSADFATIKSALSNAPTAKFFGVNHGGSAAATSGTISKTLSHVRSGIYRMTLKAAETNYDYVLYRVVQPSCADQLLAFPTLDNDDSDLMSALTVIQSMASDAASAATQANSRILVVQSQASDAYSAIIAPLASMTSDVASAVWAHAVGTRVDSRILVAQSFLSDIRSHVSDLQSDFQSRVPKRVATDSQLSDLHSDLRSFLVVLSGIQSDIYSALSDFQSDFQSRVPKRVATDSQLSDLSSDLKSAIALTLTVSNISDIGSRVWSEKYHAHSLASSFGSLFSVLATNAAAGSSRALLAESMASDAASAAQQVNSRVLVAQSFLSDIRSHVSDLQSDFQSRVPKRVATDSQLSDLASDLKSAIGAIAVSVSASDISDIASAVQAILSSDLSDILSAATQANSRVLLNQSRISDVYSLLSDFQSDFGSRIPKEPAARSQLSDLHSDLRSYLVVMSGVQSDVYSLLSDVQSDFQSRVPKRVATDSQLSDLASDLRSYLVGLSAIASDAASAAQQANSRVLVAQSQVSDVYSLVSDLQSDFQSRVPKLVATGSQLSDLASDIVSDLKSFVGAGVPLDASTLSDLRSAIAGVATSLSASDISDIASAVAAAVTTVTASDISDIASAVQAILTGNLSEIYSAAQQTNSRVLVVESLASDIRSHVSDFQSDFQSRVPKRVATDSQVSDLASDLKSALGNIPITLSASDISDIASAVRVGVVSDLSDILSATQQANSRLLVNQSRVSDIYSLLSDVQSDFQSRVPKRVATDSQLSDLHSDLKSHLTVSSGVQSDIYSLLSDVRSDFQSRVPKRVATDSQLSALTSDVLSAIGDIALGTPPTASQIADEVETRSLMLSSAERTAIANALLDLADAIETGVTLRGSTRLQLAALAGKLSGANTSTTTIRNAVADTKDRIVATTDATGRTSVTTDQT